MSREAVSRKREIASRCFCGARYPDAALDELEGAKVRIPGHPNSAWDDGIAAFLKDGDEAALLEVYMTATP